MAGKPETQAEDRAVSRCCVSGAMPIDPDFEPLRHFLLQTPAIEGPIGTGMTDAGFWWVKFAIDINHPLARNVVQGVWTHSQLRLAEREAADGVHASFAAAIHER